MRNWMRLGTVPVLAAALWFAGCSDQAPLEQGLLGPDAAAFAKGGNGKAAEKAPKVRGKKSNGSTAEFKFATGRLSKEEGTHVQQVVGPEGGRLSVAGHVLVVPQGAVAQPTIFKMRQYKKIVADSSTIIAVDLKAIVEVADPDDLDGDGLLVEEIDIGEQGFATPVGIYLTYRWSDNVDDSNVDSSTIVWLKSSSYAEEVPHTVVKDKGSKWVYTLLDHFSDYALVVP